jgi:tetratricopeptide (TPR) repeat protein
MRRTFQCSWIALAAAAGLSLGLATSALAAGSEPPTIEPPKVDAKPAAKPAEKPVAKPADKPDAAKAAPKKEEAKPPPPAEKQSFRPSPAWIAAYREAALLIKQEKYEEAIAALAALPNAELSADAQNYLGFANRKLKNMSVAKTYYEKALELDPTHKGALEYFGEWHAEVGDLEGAQKLLARLETACGGRNCEEYADLAKAIRTKEAAGLMRPRG